MRLWNFHAAHQSTVEKMHTNGCTHELLYFEMRRPTRGHETKQPVNRKRMRR